MASGDYTLASDLWDWLFAWSDGDRGVVGRRTSYKGHEEKC